MDRDFGIVNISSTRDQIQSSYTDQKRYSTFDYCAEMKCRVVETMMP